MIYVFVGTDIAKRSAAALKFLEKASGSIVRFDDSSADPARLHDLIGGSDLFGDRYVVVLDGLLDSSFGEAVMGQLGRLAESTNTFVIIESVIPKARLADLAEVAEEVAEFAAAKKKGESFNIFSITDAFGARDKKNTWILYQDALAAGVAPEEVLNIIIWQVKNISLAASARSAGETGLAPFVFTKAKSYSRNFKPEELVDMSRTLAALFHEGHLGTEVGPNLELFLLKTL